MLNADLGEGMPHDAALMPMLDMANVACGGHAGDLCSMRETLILAAQYNVQIGAHPSYPDREGFGRRSLSLSREVLRTSLRQQLQDLNAVASDLSVAISHVKPHGALYNDMMQDTRLLHSVLETVSGVFPGAGFMLLATCDHEYHRAACEQYGLSPLFEVFADRAYSPNGTLLSRTQPGAVLNDAQALARVSSLLSRQVIAAHDGTELRFPMHTVCVHGDNPAAVTTVTRIREVLSRG